MGESNSRFRNLTAIVVDLPRIELGTVQCECTGIPFTYKPAGKAGGCEFGPPLSSKRARLCLRSTVLMALMRTYYTKYQIPDSRY